MLRNTEEDVSGSREKLALLLIDFLTINAGTVLILWIKYQSGPWAMMDRLWAKHNGALSGPTFPFVLENYLVPIVLITAYWILLFLFFGLYGSWKAGSRFDEIVGVGKITVLGSLALLIPLRVHPNLEILFPSPGKLMLYWGLMIAFVGTGRIGIRTFQRHLLIKGIGRRRAAIVGCDERGRQLLRDVRDFPALGRDVVGFVRNGEEDPQGRIEGVPILGKISELPGIIRTHRIDEVLIAHSGSRTEVLDLVSSSDLHPVTVSVVPDLYDIASGRVRTNQIYGFPLVEIFPTLMPAWERRVKRSMDVVISILILVGLAPIWALVGLLIKLDSRGPVFFGQKRVGRNGEMFTAYKFRSMIPNAEEETGPVWAEENDPRITRVGRALRKLRIDEVPQFLNVLDGDMSIVGPRPERPYFVGQFRQEIPLYTRRWCVQPGITGWAQTKHRYDRSLDDVREKLKYDLFYIENMSLRMDIKILLRTIWVMLGGRGAR